jgi:Bacterial regulatory helix-turn-helix protein, lysR family
MCAVESRRVGFRVRGSNEHNWEYRIVTWVVPSLIGDVPERRIVMTDLNSLMIFAKVVEAKSFSEAARLLKMPTSTVSRRVADLWTSSACACSNVRRAACG